VQGALFALILFVWSAQTLAARAHVHGQGELDIAVDAGRVDITLIAPRADVNDETSLVSQDPFTFQGASCQLESSRVGSAAAFEASWFGADAHGHAEHEGPEESDRKHDNEAHADSYLIWTYQCSQNPNRLSVGLFASTTLARIRVQAVGESGAGESGAIGADVTPEAVELELP
jgi:hypothetical protein